MTRRTRSDKPLRLGENVDTQGRKHLLERRAGWHGAIVPPSRDAIRAAIESQVCPWCGKGPFKMLPVHTNKAHAVDKYELRDLAGFTTADSLISDEARRAMQDHAASLSPEERRERATKAASHWVGKKRQGRRWTAAAKVSPVKEMCVRGHSLTDPRNVRLSEADGYTRRACRACHALNERRARSRRARTDQEEQP